jgi:hypothetical protein
MTETAAPVQPMSLFSRAIGIITAPKATYENVVAAPRPFGILLICALLIGIGSTIPQLTENGRKAALDMQVKGMERMGMTVTPEIYQRLETQSQNKLLKLLGAAGTLIVLPIIALVITSILWAVFNAIMGGTATFKQVLAVVTHSYVITTLAVIAALPIQMMQAKIVMGGPFNLGALAPGIDETSTIARFLSSISVFSLWGWWVTAVGLGVLYKRNATSIAIGLILVFLAFMFAVTAAFGSFLGR